MSSRNTIVVGILVLVALTGGGVWYYSHQSTSSTAMTPNASSSEKDQIIAAILNRQQVFSSGNAPQIRAYLATFIVGNPNESARVAALSDSALLDEVKFMNALAVTEAQLRSPEAQWEITDTKATISFSSTTDQGGTATMRTQAVKVGGQWY